jgi:glutathione S-transferase
LIGLFDQAPILREGMTDIPADRLENMHKAYELTEALLDNSDYLVDDSLTLADISCLATLSTAMRLIPIDAVKYVESIRFLLHLCVIL